MGSSFVIVVIVSRLIIIIASSSTIFVNVIVVVSSRQRCEANAKCSVTRTTQVGDFGIQGAKTPKASTSSCTDLYCESNSCHFTSQCNRNNIKCGNSHCHRCCNFINDYTYAVLKKICRKIIKDFQRQQCREKYTIFDGGNSVNVRIHRASSLHYDKSQSSSKMRLGPADSTLVGGKRSKFGKSFSSMTAGRDGEAAEKGRGRRDDVPEKAVVGSRNSSRLLEKDRLKSRGRQAIEEGDNDAADSKGRHAKSKKRREADVDDDSGDEKSKGAKGRKSKNKQQLEGGDQGDSKGGKSKTKRSLGVEDEDDTRGKKNRGKRDQDEEAEADAKGKKNKGRRNADDEEETERKSKTKGRRTVDAEDADDGRGKKSKAKQSFGKEDEIGESKSSRKSKNKKQHAGDDSSVDIDDLPQKKGKGKRGTKHDADDMPIITDLRRKVRRGDEVAPTKRGRNEGDSVDKSGRVGRGSAFDEEFARGKKNKRKSGKDMLEEQKATGSKSLGGRSGKSLPNVRGSQKFPKDGPARSGRGPKNLASVLNLHGRRFTRPPVATPDTYTNKFVKPSRCDEARPCDYLRANMEQREMFKLCEAGQCTARTCSTWPCSDIYSCCQPPVSCVG